MYKSKVYRQVWKAESNNSYNPNKNICALAVAQVFSVGNETKYLHTTEDLLRALRKRWSALKIRYSRRETLGQFKLNLRDCPLVGDEIVGYVVHVAGHVLALTPHGHVFTDTAQDDNNIVLRVWAVRNPAPNSKAAYRNFTMYIKEKLRLDNNNESV